MRTTANLSMLALLMALSIAACSDLKTRGEQCIFNDDCASPFACAAARCRVQCRSDRDCSGGQLCAPSDDPAKRVCIAPQDNAICASDRQCPPAAACIASGCWWPCRDDSACGQHAAGVCLRPERLCSVPATVVAQREAPDEPGDGGVMPTPDVPGSDAPGSDVPASDIPGSDIPVWADAHPARSTPTSTATATGRGVRRQRLRRPATRRKPAGARALRRQGQRLRRTTGTEEGAGGLRAPQRRVRVHDGALHRHALPQRGVRL